MRQRLGFNFYDVFVVTFCVLFALICFYPMWYVFIASLTPYEEFVKGGLMLWPTGGVDFQYYNVIFNNSSFISSLWISASKTVIGTALSLLVTSTMAYAVSKVHVPGMKVLNLLTVFTMFFSGGLVPSFILISKLGLYNTRWALILPGAIGAYYVIIARTFFQSIPDSLTESAKLDGANDIVILQRIIIPLSMPIVAVLTLYYAVSHWNSYFGAMVYIVDKKLQPLQLYLRRLLIENTGEATNSMANGEEKSLITEQIKYAVIIVSTLPILCVYPFLQKYFVKGVMIGAIKA